MGINIATSSQLAEAQRIAIEQTRFTAEHNAPCLQLIEQMRLKDGEKSVTVPKVGQMTAASLQDGVDLTDSADIGMTTTSLTASEVGLKVILTDKLVRQENEDVFRMVGRQMGDAMGRKKDTDVLGLFTALNGGTDLSATTRDLELPNLLICIAWARANKLPRPISVVVHPWSMYRVIQSHPLGIAGGGTTGAGVAAFPDGDAKELLADFWRLQYDGVNVYDDGNITVDANGDGQGAIFSRESLVYLESVGFETEQERDASMRATEIVVTADYGVFELDDSYGAGMLFRASAEATD